MIGKIPACQLRFSCFSGYYFVRLLRFCNILSTSMRFVGEVGMWAEDVVIIWITLFSLSNFLIYKRIVWYFIFRIEHEFNFMSEQVIEAKLQDYIIITVVILSPPFSTSYP